MPGTSSRTNFSYPSSHCGCLAITASAGALILSCFQIVSSIIASNAPTITCCGVLLVIRPAQWVHKLLHLLGGAEAAQVSVNDHQRERLVRILAIKLADDR